MAGSMSLSSAGYRFFHTCRERLPIGIGQSDLVPAEPAGCLRPNPVTVQIQGLNSGKKGNAHFYHAAFRQSTARMVT